MKTHAAQDIVKSIADGLLSLLDGNGFVDNYAISEEKDYNFFDTGEKIGDDDKGQ